MERRLQEWEKFIEDDQNTPMTSEENTKNTQQTSSSSQIDMPNMTKTDNPIKDASNANASEIVDPTSPTGDETPPQMEGSSDEDDDAVS